ncbi:hypothetical protein NQ317_003451 [Molorchus minor]|uniref:Uncharacterized protein n=1 Tax=Molorchus minor TaxID=1323400 RepID=A0ABQ9K1B5_9CUCU|nr:hypothetical protein NQ317_003451 [Molorchus minor]
MPKKYNSVLYTSARTKIIPNRNPTWWKRRTSLERCLTLSTAVAFLVGISLIIALATVHNLVRNLYMAARI